MCPRCLEQPGGITGHGVQEPSDAFYQDLRGLYSIPGAHREGERHRSLGCTQSRSQIGASERGRERSCEVAGAKAPKGKLGGHATFHILRWGWGAYGYGKICHYSRWCDPMKRAGCVNTYVWICAEHPVNPVPLPR